MALDDLIPEDIDCVYAAKLMAPHLELKGGPHKLPLAQKIKAAIGGKFMLKPADALQYPVSSWGYFIKHYLTDSNYRQQVKEERKRDKGCAETEDAKEKAFVQKLSDAGIAMPQGRQAYSIACGLSNYFGLLRFWRKGEHPPGVEVLDVDESLRRSPNREIRMPQILFEHILGAAISYNVYSMNDDGYRINQDFNEKAKTSILQETYSRLEKGKRFNLLEAVNIGIDEQQRVYLRGL